MRVLLMLLPVGLLFTTPAVAQDGADPKVEGDCPEDLKRDDGTCAWDEEGEDWAAAEIQCYAADEVDPLWLAKTYVACCVTAAGLDAVLLPSGWATPNDCTGAGHKIEIRERGKCAGNAEIKSVPPV